MSSLAVSSPPGVIPLKASTFGWLCALMLVSTASAQEMPIPPDMKDYVTKPDTSYAWKLATTYDLPAGKVYDIALTSQTWQGIPWEHNLQVYVPKNVTPKPTMVLYNTGGKASPTGALLGLAIAEKVGAPVAFLYGIPKQPLFGGKTEDALIAETFVRYLETKDSSWPLLFPMVKSLVRAMDALQAFSKQEWKTEIKDFVVTGASKRGWTSWLTAATQDPRVKAIAPMVIDTLNFPVQMENQVKAFGKPSEMIRDYTMRKLVPLPDTPEAKKLWGMVDPWIYRSVIKQPKMLIFGTNDPYWPQDALNSYWDDLVGEKYALYVPNAGHDLREVDAAGKKADLPMRAVNSLAAFSKSQILGKPLPEITWKHAEAQVTLTPTTKPKEVRLWVAKSASKDFRKSTWESTSAPVTDGKPVVMTVGKPEAGYQAYFAEAVFDLDGLPFHQSTQIRILEAKP